MVQKYKIVIQQLFLASFRVPIFTKLVQRSKYSYLFLHGTNLSNDGRLSVGQDVQLKHIELKNVEVKIFGFTIRFQKNILETIKSEKPNVIVVEGTTGILSNWLVSLYCRFSNIPLVFWYCGWEAQSKNIMKKIKWLLAYPYLSSASSFIAYGSESKEILIEMGANENKIFIAQNTIDTDEIQESIEHYIKQAEKLKAEMQIGNKLVILYVGAINAGKKVNVLIDAYRQLKAKHENIALIIVGDGPEKKELQKLVLNESIQDVTFTGKIVDDVNKYFSLCDIFVLPGLGGLAINQAMAIGKTVICGGGDGTEKDLIVNNETGFLVNTMDCSDLVKTIEYLYEHPEELKRISANAQKYIYEKASVSNMLNSFEAAIDYAIKH